MQAAAERGVDFYGSWKPVWEQGERDAHGRGTAFQAQAFVYDEAPDRYLCPAGQFLILDAIQKRDTGVQAYTDRTARAATCQECSRRTQCAPAKTKAEWSRSITRNVDPAAVTAFKRKRATPEAQAVYRVRSQVAEFPHAWIKERCGIRQFRCRGQWKVACEALWGFLSYNLSRWFAIRRQGAERVAAEA